MNTEFRDNIAGLLTETAHAHHKAFESTDGADPDWPIWYADFSKDKFAEQFGLKFTRSKLVYCLMNADMEHKARAPEAEWSEFYANEIVEHCGRSETPDEDALTLYYSNGCPFCNLVRSAINQLGVDVELRNIFEKSEYRKQLIDVRGRATVPVLRITSPDGEDRWMPESRDIVDYLQETYSGSTQSSIRS
jgi:glutaredoxin